jgi:plasmid stabilization system protein ParE
MESINKLSVGFSDKAEQDLDEILNYIAQQGYPETALNYTKRLRGFCHTIGFMPEKYAICRHQRFARWQFRCATFEDTYIIVYTIEMAHLTVKRIIHGKQMK